MTRNLPCIVTCVPEVRQLQRVKCAGQIWERVGPVRVSLLRRVAPPDFGSWRPSVLHFVVQMGVESPSIRASSRRSRGTQRVVGTYLHRSTRLLRQTLRPRTPNLGLTSSGPARFWTLRRGSYKGVPATHAGGHPCLRSLRSGDE